MIEIPSLRERHKTRLKVFLYHLTVYTFATYGLLRLVQVTGLFYVESVLQLDLVWTVATVSGVLSLVLYVDAGELPSRSKTAIQYVFVVSLVALVLATSARPPLSGVSEFLRSVSAPLRDIVVITGVVSLFSVRSNEVRPALPRGRWSRLLRRGASYRKYSVGLAVLAIIGYYVYIRWPFLANPFGRVAHGDKYGLHVPYLQGMYRTANPFHMVNLSSVSMFSPDAHVIGGFWYIPIFEWSTLPLLVLSDASLEFLVRSVITAQGGVLLVISFIFLRDLFDEVTALLGTLLLATNEIFNLVSFLTVMDLPALVFTVLGFALYWRGQKTHAYLVCGLAALTKYSFLLIAVFPVWILILSNERDKLYNSVKLGYFTVAPILLFRVLVAPAAGGPPADGSLRVLYFVVVLALSAFVFERYERVFVSAVSKIDRQVRHVSLALAPLFGIALLQGRIREYASDFLTDRYLVFNANLYSAMLDQIRALQPDAVFYLFPIGVIWTLSTGDRKKRSVVAALVVAAVFYGVLASKSIFIHTYYNHVFVLVCIFGFVGLIDALRRLDVSPTIGVTASVVVVLLLAFSSQAATTTAFDQEEKGTQEMAEYIDGRVSDSELIFYSGSMGRLVAIYSDARFTPDWRLSERDLAALRSEIGAKGLGGAFHDRNVTHYLSHGPAEFDELRYLRSNRSPESDVRRDYILSKVEPDRSVDQPYDEVPAPDEFFALEAKIGTWHLYEITACPTDSASNSETETADVRKDARGTDREPDSPSNEAPSNRGCFDGQRENS